ncbi:DsbA family protein [Hymenobacter sp. BT175]|uniref:DsbA family protein n=1 Tax=Hymenobacter translucens TaxID=2886507 RepID=UPI001D0DCACE|nr:DsbA family protein [Hymenobacter translucens]MCC2546917.1 DsbA family protein [Hymenobacter translucens]
MENNPELPEVLYIYDPLCGWCYGMSPVIRRVKNAFRGRITVSVLSGGMVTGDQVGPIRQMWPYISSALHNVEQATGVTFGEAYQQLGAEGSYIQDSEPPCRALTVFRQLDQQNRAIDFAHDIQKALFEHGHDLNDSVVYEALAADYGLDVTEFSRELARPETATATRQEFAAVGRIGVQGFPTVILRVGAQGYVLARGFQPYDHFAAGLEQALQDLADGK